MRKNTALLRSVPTICVIAVTGWLQAAEPDAKWTLLLAIDRDGGSINLLLDTASLELRSGFVTAVRKLTYTNSAKRSDLPARHEESDKIAVDCNTGRLAYFDDGVSGDQLAWRDASSNYINKCLLDGVCALRAAQLTRK